MATQRVNEGGGQKLAMLTFDTPGHSLLPAMIYRYNL